MYLFRVFVIDRCFFQIYPPIIDVLPINLCVDFLITIEIGLKPIFEDIHRATYKWYPSHGASAGKVIEARTTSPLTSSGTNDTISARKGCAVMASLAAQSNSCGRVGNVTSCKVEGAVRLKKETWAKKYASIVTLPAFLVFSFRRRIWSVSDAANSTRLHTPCVGDTCFSTRLTDLLPELRVTNDFAGITAWANGLK
uniref:Secreted protein n=1 Tax=Panagrellus redivivus TaxID=6233 RepID=A0A7E4VLF3_PANRE